MSSVYFPAHVVVLFRRLVNVVSTLSISNQYVLQKQRDGARIGISDEAPNAKPLSYEHLRNMEWSRWLYGTGSGWMVSKGDAVSDCGMVLKAAISLPNLIPGWSSLFASPKTVSNGSNFHDTPPPIMPHEPEDQPPQKLPPRAPTEYQYPADTIHLLLSNPALVDPIRTPRYPIVLCHGLYGFDSRGPSTFPSMRMHYWANVLNVLRGRVGADVIVTSVPGTGSISSRAAKLDEQLQLRARGRGINFLAHSMGGLDCRHLISHIQPYEYAPLSLTSISTPHRGSPFMDWCQSNIGIGKLRQQEQQRAEAASQDEKVESSFAQSLSSFPSSFTTLLLSVVDSPAYANLTSNYLNEVFNPNTPDDPHVKYFSVAGRMSADSVSVWHPFWLPKMVLDGVEEKERERLKKDWEQTNRDHMKEGETPFWADEREWGNDGLVTIQSAKWGEFLGTMEGCDHWEMRGARGIEFGVDIPAIPAIGLGSLPLASSLSNLRRPSAGGPSPANAHGDGWGFGDWTRFVGAWKKNKGEAATDKAGSVHRLHKHTPAEADVHKASMGHHSSVGTSPAAFPLSPVSGSTATDPSPARLDGPVPRSALSGAQGDHDDAVVKSSTDTLSVVFDWLIERVPAPPGILRRAPAEKGKEGAESLPSMELSASNAEKELSAAAVAHAVSGRGDGSRAAPSSPPSSPPSEMKRRMEKEDKGRRKQRELATKGDLERFYIALSRKMYEAGL